MLAKTFARVSWFTRLKLLLGRPRRLFLNTLRRGYVRASHARRKGECIRCGACCAMGARCRFLGFDGEGLATCAVYGRRLSPNCKTFPIDVRDIADRNVVAPHVGCGFHFAGVAGRQS